MIIWQRILQTYNVLFLTNTPDAKKLKEDVKHLELTIDDTTQEVCFEDTIECDILEWGKQPVSILDTNEKHLKANFS